VLPFALGFSALVISILLVGMTGGAMETQGDAR